MTGAQGDTHPAVPQEICDLVDRYSREERGLQSDRYGEADTRKEFIEPLFGALGWDVLNSAKHAEPYKDVVNEHNLKIGTSHGAPDYAFRVGGIRKFFVEAKRPGIDITRDGGAAYQLRRYGWTAKLPLSVLTNFRHIAVYDCSQAPSQEDRASAARTLLVSWDELTSRWAEIDGLLGKTSVYQGALDRYAVGAAKRRGTLQVDEAYLAQMETWRSQLAKNIAERNRALTVEQLNEAVQQTIDRIVFFRFAEDRGIETYERLRDQLKGKGVYARLVQVFKDADTRYNSGLFHFRKEKGVSGAPDVMTPSLSIDDQVLRKIVNDMYYPGSPYEFSVLPVDILGQVYEQFLGRVIHLESDRSVTIREKPEVKHAGGVYYTPTYIVDHIVERTIGRLLQGKSAAQALNLRIVDPACGSGSFLLGAFDHLLEWFTLQYSKLVPKQRSKYMYEAGPSEWKLTLAQRKKILTSCLYGVDIDRQAVEVTKLSLMLKVLEGESGESINRQLQLFHAERVLPDLDQNIKCGNSLVGSDASTHLVLTPEEEDALNPFDWHAEFPTLMRAGGFHAVIGNPPYDVLEKDRGGASWPHDKLRQYLPFNRDFDSALGGKLNLYRLFLIRSIDLVRTSGRFGMIVPLSLAADISTASTRKFVLSRLGELEFDCFPQKDVPARRVFKKAKLSTMVVTGLRPKKLSGSEAATVRVFPGNSLSEPHLQNQVRAADCKLIDPAVCPIPLTDADEWELCRNLHTRPSIVRLGDLNLSFKISRGEINTSINRNFLSQSPTGNEAMLKGAQVGQFEIRSSLSQGEQEWLNADAFRASRKRKVPEPPATRIATQRVTGVDERSRLIAALVSQPTWFSDSTNSIAAVDGAALSLEYLLALLNSDLFQWRFRLTSTNNNVGTNELKAMPIRVPTGSEGDSRACNAIVRSGSTIALLTQARAGASGAVADRQDRRIRAEWRKLNRLVYEFYEVAPDEQALIEARLNQTPIAAQISEAS